LASQPPQPTAPRIALTPGEPAGIGPDLAILLAQTWRSAEVIAIGDQTVLRDRAKTLNLPLEIRPFDPDASVSDDPPGTLCMLDVPVAAAVTPGTPDIANAHSVLKTLDIAADGCMDGTFDAMVTAPLHKGVINQAGIPFSGHTEYLAERVDAQPVMMLVTEAMRVALADLMATFAIENPRILVAGLNPHAGENGYLGREEIDIIEPTLERLVAEGMQLIGPLPAVTLGLPLIRTSVDHGTALDKAGKGDIDPGSLFSALDLASKLAAKQCSRGSYGIAPDP